MGINKRKKEERKMSRKAGSKVGFKGSREHRSLVFMKMWKQNTITGEVGVINNLINLLGQKEEPTNNGIKCRSSLLFSQAIMRAPVTEH